MNRLKISQHALPLALSWQDLVCHPHGMDEDCTGPSMLTLQRVVLPKCHGQRSTSAPGAGWAHGELHARGVSCELRPPRGPQSQEAAACIPRQRWSHRVVPPLGGGWRSRRGWCPPGEPATSGHGPHLLLGREGMWCCDEQELIPGSQWEFLAIFWDQCMCCYLGRP